MIDHGTLLSIPFRKRVVLPGQTEECVTAFIK